MKCVVCTIPHLYKSPEDRNSEHTAREERMLTMLFDDYIGKRNPNNLDFSRVHKLSRLLDMSMIIEMYRHKVLEEPVLCILVTDYVLMTVPDKKSINDDQTMAQPDDVQTTQPENGVHALADVKTRPVAGVQTRPVASVRTRPVASVQTRPFAGVQTRWLPVSAQTTPEGGVQARMSPDIGFRANIWSNHHA